MEKLIEQCNRDNRRPPVIGGLRGCFRPLGVSDTSGACAAVHKSGAPCSAAPTRRSRAAGGEAAVKEPDPNRTT